MFFFQTTLVIKIMTINARETNVQHLFFFLTGILAGQWVIGGDVVHSLYAVRRRQHHLALDIISQ